MERMEFVAQGQMQIGPSGQFFLFLNGEHLGHLLAKNFGLPKERGYTDLGRVAVERLED